MCIPLVWPYCIPVLLLPLERDSELLRERESVLRLRERRWLDGASFDAERGSTSRDGEPSLDKKTVPLQSPVSLGEELQWWPDKVGVYKPERDRHLEQVFILKSVCKFPLFHGKTFWLYMELLWCSRFMKMPLLCSSSLLLLTATAALYNIHLADVKWCHNWPLWIFIYICIRVHLRDFGLLYGINYWWIIYIFMWNFLYQTCYMKYRFCRHLWWGNCPLIPFLCSPCIYRMAWGS